MKKPRVKVGEYKRVFKGLLIDVFQTTARFPSGQIKTFERGVKAPSVCIMAIDEKGRLILIREYRLRHNRYEIRLPAGRIEKNESPKAAAQRELREETGFRAKNLKLFHKSEGAQSLIWSSYVFLATGLTPDPLVGDEDEDITLMPTSLTKALKMVKEETIKNEFISYLIFKLYNQRSRLS